MHVAVVDPSRTVLKAVSRLLAKDHHEVSTLVDGPHALAHIDQLLKRGDSAPYHAETGGRGRVVAAGRPAAKTDTACVSDVLRSASRPKHNVRSMPMNECTASGRVARLLVAQPGGHHVVSAAQRN